MVGALRTRLSHSRGFATAAILVMIAGVLLCYLLGDVEAVHGDKGFILPSANEWIPIPWLDMLASLVTTGVVLFIMALISRIFNVLRSDTSLPLTLYALFTLSSPDLSAQFYTGSALVLLVSACIMLLFSCYRAPASTRRVFLIFMVLSAGAATQYCFILFIPVFLLGCAQMRIFNGRTLTAAFLGLLTPWWIMAGCGLLHPSAIHRPELLNIFDNLDAQDTRLLLVAVALTALLAVTAFIFNVMKTIAYNARTRAFNGVYATLSLVTLVGMCVDYRNFISYVPLLNFCAAYQVAAYFNTHRADRSYIAIWTIAAIYFTLYLCQILI